MSERYTRIYALKREDYIHVDGCPIVCIGGRILYDNQHDCVVGKVKFRILENRTIDSVTIKITPYDENDILINGTDEYTYTNINLSEGEEFGSNKAIPFKDENVRRMVVEVLRVNFFDGQSWPNNDISKTKEEKKTGRENKHLKKLVCEMCGSTDLMKQDGVFVCQYCGTKYSVEEARKMMIEGTVDVSGSTVKVDTSGELANLYQIARRAKDDNNSENAAKYYEMILIKDPSSWEANFYTIYFKAMSCKIAEITSAANSVNNCIGTTLQLISNISNDGERKNAVKEVQERSYYISELLATAAGNHYSDIGYSGIDSSIQNKFALEYVSRVTAAYGIEGEFCDRMSDVFVNDSAVMVPFGINILKNRIKEGVPAKEAEYAAIIKKYEPDYEPPKREEPDINVNSTSQASSSGCYIATAVYGSYDCPQVWTLRRYRDYTLAETWYGRVFIHIYYAISPTLVKWFGHTGWFKKLWKCKLDRMVTNLNSSGVENTPYEDRNW